MIFTEKNILLKNGVQAVLRNPKVEDAEALIDFIKTTSGETEFLLRYPEEWNITVEQEEAWVRRSVASDSSLVIACYINGEVAGNCSLDFYGGIKNRHRSVISISVLKKYWGLGIGSALLSELIDAASAHDGTEIIELEVIEGNDRAIRLYEKMGFKIMSEKPNAFKLKNGKMVKDYYMQKYL